MDNTRDHILRTARQMFSSNGFAKVTTDEMAASLGMSKKTLYKHFPSKRVLLEEVVDKTLADMKSTLLDILEDEQTEFVEKLQRIMAHVGDNLSRFLTKPLLRDMQRHTPELWQRFEAFRKEQINTHFIRLLDEGVSRGVFRADIHKQFAVMVYFNCVQGIINPETLAHLPVTANEAFETILKIIFEGILTDEGRAYFLHSAEN